MQMSFPIKAVDQAKATNTMEQLVRVKVIDVYKDLTCVRVIKNTTAAIEKLLNRGALEPRPEWAGKVTVYVSDNFPGFKADAVYEQEIRV